MASNHSEDILEAVARNDLEAVKYLVEVKKVSLKTVNELQQTAAHIAVEEAHLNVLRYVLDQDDSLLRAEDCLGCTVLHTAVEKGNLFLVKYLVEERGADIFAPIEMRLGNTAVHLAVQSGYLPILQYFIEEKYANFNLRNRIGESLLFIAAEKQHLQVVKYLVERWNADVNMVDGNQHNILFVSARVGDLTIPQYLLDDRNVTSLDVNKRDLSGRTIIYFAAMYGYRDFIRYFVEKKGADLSIPDFEKKTPLHQAACSGNVAVVMYLVANGANPHAQDSNGKTPMDVTLEDKVTWFLKRAMHQRRVRSAPYPPTYEAFSIPGDRTPHRLISNRLELLADEPPVARVSDISISNGQSFLFLVDVLVRYLTYPRTRSQFSWIAPLKIRQSKIDPVAVAIVNSGSSEFAESLLITQ